jgi:hypothetical protein
LQRADNLSFSESENAAILCYAKQGATPEDTLLIAVNVDPHQVQETMVSVPLALWQKDAATPFAVEDLLCGERYTWCGARTYVRLDPSERVAHVFRLVARDRRHERQRRARLAGAPPRSARPGTARVSTLRSSPPRDGDRALSLRSTATASPRACPWSSAIRAYGTPTSRRPPGSALRLSRRRTVRPGARAPLQSGELLVDPTHARLSDPGRFGPRFRLRPDERPPDDATPSRADSAARCRRASSSSPPSPGATIGRRGSRGAAR